MPTNFPTSVDNFANPTPTDSLNAPAHSGQHTNANDAIEAVEAYLLNGGQGLTLVKKQTIGTAVSSVVVSDAFNATYENYKIIVSGGAASTNNFFNVRLGATVSGYRHQLAGGNFSATAQLIGSTSTSAWFYFGTCTTDGLSLNADILSPQLAKITTISGYASDIGSWSGMSTGVIPSATQYTAFTLLANAGTLTGGTIYVYGYGKGQ